MKKQILFSILSLFSAIQFSIAQCDPPTQLSASAVSTTSATISFAPANANYISWDIILIPGPITPETPSVDPVVGNGTILINTTTTTNVIPNLSNATIYYTYVRTHCAADELSSWAGPFLFFTQTCAPEDKCNYKFILTDAGANGWNGGRMQVRQNGIIVATIGATISGPGPTTVTVALCSNVPFDLYWSIAGTAPDEIGFSIQNPFTDIIYTKLPGQGTPLSVLHENTGNCTPPSCPKPTSATIITDSTTQTSSQLSWTETGNATSWEVYAVPVGGPAPVNGTPLNNAAPYYLALSNPYTITGLSPATQYIYYVRAICSASDISTWNILNPKTFTTKPINDECANAFSVPVNPTRTSTELIHSSTLGATRSLPNTNPVCQGNTDDDIWFSFTATSTIHIITLSNVTGSTTDVNHTLYAGTDCANLVQLYCSNPNVSVATNLIPGMTYKIRVYTNGGNVSQSANFDLAITTPPPVSNDDCATATVIIPSDNPNCGSPVSSSLTGATASANETSCAGTEDDDVWFTFVANGTGQIITISNIAGTTLDLTQSLYLADGCNLALVNCNQEDVNVVMNLTPGQTYKIRVWSVSNIAEDVTFDICIRKIATPLTTSTEMTPQQLVTNVLLNNPCTTVSNITSSTGTNFASVNGIGSFGNSPFPLSSGIVLSSGNVLNIPGPNLTTMSAGTADWPGDQDLNTIIGAATSISMNSQNASVLEFDFSTPTAYMSFNYIFASEEYGSFQCSFSDAFAFLLTDLETNITKNLAVIPGTTTPVSVITIRDQQYNTSCESQNSTYFDNYFYDDVYATGMNFNGQTKLMTAASDIIPNHPYHIKLVVADRQDSAFDSAVFIQAGSFASGPPQCTDKLQLVAFLDSNANGTRDDGESDFTYGNFVYQINDTGAFNNISSPLGLYTIYDDNPSDSYDFSFTINPEYSAYFASSAAGYNNITITTGSGTQTLYFPIMLTQSYNDVSVSIIPVTTPVPGSTYTNKIIYKNLGIATTSGTLSFTAAPLATITSVTQSTTLSSTGFTYNFSNLGPYETRYDLVTMTLPAIPAANIGDLITNSATISAPSNDINIANNAFTNTQVAVAAYDPNNKLESHGSKIGINQFSQNDYLFYTINFQNTGTAHASNVRLEDLLDAQLDETSIRMVSASHNYIMERVNNNVIWKFDYIQLPGIAENETLSKGYVTFMIKLKPGFAAGDIIPNSANIYFDTNPAITTNIFETELVTTLKNTDFTSENLIVYPNPASEMVQISLVNTTNSIENITLYDLLGKTIKTVKSIDAKQTALDISRLSKGIYMIEIITNNKFREVRKLVVQ
ncbi:MAG: choice-of-anchor L domain-containing protein [Flavobacterium sp.]|nr:choice-of-anchor L domain-containing protein [Flavobacterium sp.]